MTQRQEIIERLSGMELGGGGHEMLSAICKAVLPHNDAWTLRRCADLRDRLVRLLSVGGTGDGITDELRSSVANYPFRDNRDFSLFEAIADRIDAGHKKALHEAYTKGCDDGMGVANAKDAQAEYLRGRNDGYDEGWDAGFASADDWLAQHEDAMAEHGWYRALDADKQVIHADDELFSSDGVSCGRVTAIGVGKRAGYVWTLPDGNMISLSHLTRVMHHHKQPTVEDVLREMLCAWEDTLTSEGVDDIISEYAGKLRLAGDAE